MTAALSADMYGKYFPCEPYVTEFIPSDEQTTAVTALAESRGDGDLLPMLLGATS